MSSSGSSNLPYAPYQSHRRAASTASNSAATSAAGGSPSGNGNARGPTQQIQSDRIPQSSAVLVRKLAPQQPPVSHDSLTRPATSSHAPPSTTSRGVNLHTMPAAPPLRTAASLRAAAETAERNASNGGHTHVLLQQSSKGKEKEGTAPPTIPTTSSTRSSEALAASPNHASTRRSVSSALTVPSSASSPPVSTQAQAARTNGHTKRLSLSPASASTNGPVAGHARSSSYGAGRSVGLPQLMSTAQRLRTVSPLGHAATSSPNVASPSITPSASPGLHSAFEGHIPHHLSILPGPYGDDGIGRATAYRPGFQPKGTYRVRTDEFTAARSRRKLGGGGESSGSRTTDVSGSSEPVSTKSRSELESQRLERRLEKLLLLHYDDAPLFSEEEAFSVAPAWLPSTIRKARLQTEMERRLRDEEMRIVKWEDDKSRKACAVCTTPFSFTVRKHHCRLCGRVVCASPHLSMVLPTNAAAEKDEAGTTSADEVKCSGLVVVHGGKNSTKIKDVPRWDEAARQGLDADGRTRGIRICRTCKDTILHRQYMLDDGTVPAYVKLYEALRELQREIEQSLPEFQEMILGLQKHDSAAALGTSTDGSDVNIPHDPLVAQPSSHAATMAALKAKNRTTLVLQRDAAQARKQLLANFANYDLLAKKLRALDDGGSASLARLKVAIWTQANVFLQSNMFPLQNLPKLSAAKSSAASSRQSTPPPPPQQARHDATQNESIAVLEQQLGLVRQYAASASKARKFQDASSLNASARDLEAELARLKAS